MRQTILDGETLPIKLFTEAEAADLLNISIQKIRKIRRGKQINFYRIGGRVFYSVEMLKTFLDRCLGGVYE